MITSNWSYLIEFVGTFIFMYVIISTGQAIPIGITLAAMIYLGGKISGGAFNPAVATMLYLNKTLDTQRYVLYLFLQIVAAICALSFYQHIKSEED